MPQSRIVLPAKTSDERARGETDRELNSVRERERGIKFLNFDFDVLTRLCSFIILVSLLARHIIKQENIKRNKLRLEALNLPKPAVNVAKPSSAPKKKK